MTEMETLPEWLQTQGLTPETAQAVVTQLGIENRKVLQACTESNALRAELLSNAQQKFAFAMYEEFHRFMESHVKPGVIQSASSSSAHIFCSMLDQAGDQLSACAQKLRSLKSSFASSGVTIPKLQNTRGLHGIKIHGVHSLQRDISTLNPKSGEDGLGKTNDTTQNTWKSSVVMKELEIATTQESSNISSIDAGDIGLVKEEDGQDNDSSALQALDCVSVKENPVAVHLTNCNADCSEKEHSGSNIGQIIPRHSLLENKIQDQDQDSSPLQHQFSFQPQNAKAKTKRSKDNVLKGQKRNVCTKDFALTSKVKRHTDVETRARPHKCSVCGNDFASSGNLKIHMRIHTGERPYKCSICNKCYSQKVCLNVHMRGHTGECP
uniref:myoneurin-like n=1 Tax=Myxine glutinosa TaxID=7769 RepID=UPI00358F52D6